MLLSAVLMLSIQNARYYIHKMGTKPSQSRSMGLKPRPIEILAKVSWIKSDQHFAADVFLLLGYSNAIHSEEGKRG